jgi:anti-sigma B factor antagonist
LAGSLSGTSPALSVPPSRTYEVNYIDSGGLGTLVGVYSSARAAGADIKLTGLSQRVRDVLQITKLVTVFEVYDSEQKALAAFH